MKKDKGIIGSAAAWTIPSVLLLWSLTGVPTRAAAPYARELLPPAQGRRIGLSTLWQIPIGITPAGHNRVMRLWRVGGALYVLTSKNYLVSIAASAGTIRWTRKAPGGSGTFFRPVLYGKHRILIIAQGKVMIIHTHNGRVIRAARLEFAPGTDPLLYDGRLLIGAIHDRFVALSTTFPLFTHWFEWSGDDSFQSAPVLAEGMLVFASRRGFLWGRLPANGTDGWNRRLGGPVTAALSAGDDLVFVPCRDHKLYAVNPATGFSPWTAYLPGRLDHPVIVRGKKVLIVAGGKGLFCLGAKTGIRLWGPVKSVRRVVGTNGATLFVSTVHGNLKLINLGDGAVLAAAKLRGAVRFAPGLHGKTIYAASSHGRVAALRVRKGL